MEDELSRLMKRLQEEGESEEVQLGLNRVLGQIAEQSLKKEPQPNFAERIRMVVFDFFEEVWERIKQSARNKLIESWKRRRSHNKGI